MERVLKRGVFRDFFINTIDNSQQVMKGPVCWKKIPQRNGTGKRRRNGKGRKATGTTGRKGKFLYIEMQGASNVQPS
jgi:hypothetical protein